MSSTSRSIDNFQSLTNTNLGLEETRAESSEHAIQANLDAYVTSNNAALAASAASTATVNLATSSALQTLTTSVGAIQAAASADEGRFTTEVTRAETAEGVLTNSVIAVSASVTAEVTRAEAAEVANATNIATNAGGIVAAGLLITDLQTSRTHDQAHIVAASQAITAIQNTQIADEALIGANTTSIVAIRTLMVTDEHNIANVTQEVANLYQAYNANNINVTAQFTNVNSEITSIQATRSNDVVTSAAEVARAEAAEAVIQQEVTTLAAGVAAMSSSLSSTNIIADNITLTSGLIKSTGDPHQGVNVVLYDSSQKKVSSFAISENSLFYDNTRSATSQATLDLRAGSDPYGYTVASATLCIDMNGADSNDLTNTHGELTLHANMSHGGGNCFYMGKNSGITAGNFSVAAGVITDINDQDVTLSGTWGNFSNTQANMRFVRKGSQITVTLSAFVATPEAGSSVATYSLPVPSWAVPAVPVECAIVVCTKGGRSSGGCLLNAQNCFSILPFNGNWGSDGGINQATCFSYSL